MGRVRAALHRLDWRDRLFVARATVAIAAAATLLPLAPLPLTVRWVVGSPRPHRALPTVERMVWLADRVLALDRGPLRPNCVLRCLVLKRYLPSTPPLVVRFGVRPGVRPVDGHAWLERSGEPVFESGSTAEYLVTWSWP